MVHINECLSGLQHSYVEGAGHILSCAANPKTVPDHGNGDDDNDDDNRQYILTFDCPWCQVR